MTERRVSLSGRYARIVSTCGIVSLWALVCFANDPPLVVEPEVAAPAERDAAASENPEADALRTLTSETVAAMQQARAELADGVLSDESESLQSGILERLRRLAELVRQQSQVRTAGQPSPTGGRSAQSPNAGDGQGAAGRNLDAAESSEAATGKASGESSPPAQTRDLATSVWGHLPARQRDRMQSRFSERFLPQYEDLVRQYYEALATDEPPQK
jgi:hypothetical protein